MFFPDTFTFQLSGGNTDLSPADGSFAFVIQNSAQTALGPDGCGIRIRLGNSSGGRANKGIPNSLGQSSSTLLKNAVTQVATLWRFRPV